MLIFDQLSGYEPSKADKGNEHNRLVVPGGSAIESFSYVVPSFPMTGLEIASKTEVLLEEVAKPLTR